MRAEFVVEPWPAAADYTLILCAQDDDREDKQCAIRISVDGSTVFEGDNPFALHSWSTHAFTIPGSALKRNSVLTIENIEESGSRSGPPFFMLNYAVLRKGEG